MITQLEILQAKFQKIIRTGKGLTSKRKQLFHFTPERILYLYKTYFEDLSSQHDYPEIASVINYDPKDLEGLLLILRFKFHLYVEIDIEYSKITLPNYFPKTFTLVQEVNTTNHPFTPQTFAEGTRMFYHNDPYATTNWLNGIPLSHDLQPLDGTNLVPVTQINYDYILRDLYDSLYLFNLPDKLKCDRNILLSSLYSMENWNCEYHDFFETIVRKEFGSDYSFFKEAVKIVTDGYWTLGLADEMLQKNVELNLIAIKSNQFHYTYFERENSIPLELRESRDFNLKIIDIDPTLFLGLPDIMKEDKEIALAATKHLPWIFFNLSDQLMIDPDIRLAAFSDKSKYIKSIDGDIRLFGYHFLKWPEDWQRDREFLLASAPGIWYWPDNARRLYQEIIIEFYSKDADFFRLALQKDSEDGSIFSYADKSLRNNKDLLFAYLKAGYDMYAHMQCTLSGFASEETLQDYDFMKKVIEHFPDCLECAGDNIKDDKEIVRSAIMKDGDLLKYASLRLQADEELVRLAKKHTRDSNDEHILDFDQ